MYFGNGFWLTLCREQISSKLFAVFISSPLVRYQNLSYRQDKKSLVGARRVQRTYQHTKEGTFHMYSIMSPCLDQIQQSAGAIPLWSL